MRYAYFSRELPDILRKKNSDFSLGYKKGFRFGIPFLNIMNSNRSIKRAKQRG